MFLLAWQVSGVKKSTTYLKGSRFLEIMARLRKGVTIRRMERPFTRKSKFRSKNFARSIPHSKVVRYQMGDVHKQFDVCFELRTKEPVQIRHNALESARQTVNRTLEKRIGKGSYFFKVRVYPHHILRENPLASGAGADRMSTGMSKSYGKTIGIAARVKKDQTVFEVSVKKQHAKHGKDALKRVFSKLPCSCSIVERPLEN